MGWWGLNMSQITSFKILFSVGGGGFGLRGQAVAKRVQNEVFLMRSKCKKS